MNVRKSVYGAAAFVMCGMFALGNPVEARASLGGPGLENGSYIAIVNVPSVNINVSHDSEEILVQATQGQTFDILEDMGDGWLKIRVGEREGYIPQDGNTSISEREEIEASESEEVLEAAAVTATTERRQNLVNYALQFVGGRYRYGGDDPHTGVDCSGFTRYVMANGAGISLNRSSGSQALQGVAVSQAQMRPGDLIFYGNGSRINHVAMYIGSGQVVHASTYKTGIKISNWNYRAPVRIVNVIGD